MLTINTQRLRELIRAYYNLTHIRVAVYNPDFEEILAYPEAYTPFCRMLQENDAARCACERSAARMCKKCTETHGTVIEKCHMGLTELVTPVYNGTTVVGYIMLGQISSEEDREAFLEAVGRRGEKYGLPRQTVLEQAQQVQYNSTGQVLDSAQVVKALASYIVVSNLIYPTETLLAQSVREYITTHLGEDVSVPALCKRFSVSKSTLYRITKPYAPEGIGIFVKNLRFDKACELLLHTERSMDSIAEEAGFSDTAYFLRCFKKEKGISAGAFRKGRE